MHALYCCPGQLACSTQFSTQLHTFLFLPEYVAWETACQYSTARKKKTFSCSDPSKSSPKQAGVPSGEQSKAEKDLCKIFTNKQKTHIFCPGSIRPIP